jgi:hypothetical protein
MPGLLQDGAACTSGTSPAGCSCARDRFTASSPGARSPQRALPARVLAAGLVAARSRRWRRSGRILGHADEVHRRHQPRSGWRQRTSASTPTRRACAGRPPAGRPRTARRRSARRRSVSSFSARTTRSCIEASNSTQRPRPARLASYIAVSASRSTASARRRPARRRDADADAARLHLVRPAGVRLAAAPPAAAAPPCRPRPRADALEHDDELVAADARRGGWPRPRGPPRRPGAACPAGAGDLAQQLVAGAVAQRVVDLLEAVEVHEQHREAVARVAARVHDGALHALEHHARLGSWVSGSVRAAVCSWSCSRRRSVMSTKQVTTPSGRPSTSCSGSVFISSQRRLPSPRAQAQRWPRSRGRCAACAAPGSLVGQAARRSSCMGQRASSAAAASPGRRPSIVSAAGLASSTVALRTVHHHRRGQGSQQRRAAQPLGHLLGDLGVHRMKPVSRPAASRSGWISVLTQYRGHRASG